MRLRSHRLLIAACLVAPCSALAQPAATNLGTVVLGTPIVVNVPTLPAGTVGWYTFTLTQSVRYEDLRFLDISNTAGAGGGSADPEIALFTSTGARVAFDDEDGAGSTSLLTFGTGRGNLPAGATPTVANGRDGNLSVGTYYLAVAFTGISWGTTNWSANYTSTAQLNAHAMTIDAAALVPTSPAAGFTDLGTLPRDGTLAGGPDALAAGQVRWYKVLLPSAVASELSYVDMDTEGTSLAPTNSTRMTLYGPNGAVQGNASFSTLSDTADGSGSLSQLTFGQTTPTRPASGTGLTYNGRDGVLRAGPYYVAVSGLTSATPSNATAVGANFGMTSTSANTGTVMVNFASGAQVTSPTATATATPNNGPPGQVVVLKVTVTSGQNPPSTGLTVNIDGALIDAGAIAALDNGAAPDAAAGDLIFTAQATVGANAASGTQSLPVTVTDDQARSANLNVNFTVVGPAPACPTGDESFPLTDLSSDGGSNGAANGVATISPTGSYTATAIRISGRFVANNAFGADARVRLVSPSGAVFNLTPFTSSAPSGVPNDVASVELALPCAVPVAGDWQVRTYENIDDTGVDGQWLNLCVAFVSGTIGGDPTIWAGDSCSGDAGELPASAQMPAGSGTLSRINGIVATSADTDMYLINICDISTFSATTVGTTTGDTQLFLFRPDGTGVIHNDDTGGAGGLQSTMDNLGGQITASGDYYLVLSPYNRDPQDVGNALLWNNTNPGGTFTGVRGPDGPGAANTVDHWTGTATSTVPFTYGIILSGACYSSGGGGGGCNPADITEIGGTFENPGNPDDQLTVDDIIVFINTFSDGTTCPGTPGTPCSVADITEIGGSLENPGIPDGQLTVDDIIVFFNAFSDGCLP